MMNDESTTGTTGLIQLPSAKDAPAPKMVDLFELDDEIYSIPAEPSSGVALRYLQLQSTEGPDAATYYMLITMLGDDAYNALANHPALPSEAMEQVIVATEKVLLGGGAGKAAEVQMKKAQASSGGRRRKG